MPEPTVHQLACAADNQRHQLVWICNQAYLLKLYRGIRSRARLRPIIAKAWVTLKVGTSGEFIAAWKLLIKRGAL